MAPSQSPIATPKQTPSVAPNAASPTLQPQKPRPGPASKKPVSVKISKVASKLTEASPVSKIGGSNPEASTSTPVVAADLHQITKSPKTLVKPPKNSASKIARLVTI